MLGMMSSNHRLNDTFTRCQTKAKQIEDMVHFVFSVILHTKTTYAEYTT